VQSMQKALKIGLEYNFLDVVLRTYNNLSVEAETEDAFEISKKGLDYAKRVGYIGWQIQFQAGIGEYYRTVGELQRGEEVAKQVIRESKAIGSTEGEKLGYSLLGNIYLSRGDLQSSEEYLKLWHSKVEGTTDFQNSIWSEYTLGLLYLEKGTLSTADEYLKRAWTVSQTMGLDKIGTYLVSMAQLLVSLIEVELEEEKLNAAKTHLEELKKIASQTTDVRASAGVHYSVGRVLAIEGDFKASAEEFRKALEVCRNQKDVYGVIKTLYELGSVYQKAGDLENASKSFEEARETSMRIGSRLYVDRILAKMNKK
jgi:tetratricopeptide (TPR) repeat protein